MKRCCIKKISGVAGEGRREMMSPRGDGPKSIMKPLLLEVPKGLYKNTSTMNLSLFLFLIGILGFILNRKNIILMIIAIEIMLLAVTLLILISSFSFDDGLGQTFSIFIIAIAGAESVIGLSILVAYYRLRGNISLRTNS